MTVAGFAITKDKPSVRCIWFTFDEKLGDLYFWEDTLVLVPDTQNTK